MNWGWDSESYSVRIVVLVLVVLFPWCFRHFERIWRCLIWTSTYQTSSLGTQARLKGFGIYLGGGFKHVLFPPLFGEDSWRFPFWHIIYIYYFSDGLVQPPTKLYSDCPEGFENGFFNGFYRYCSCSWHANTSCCAGAALSGPLSLVILGEVT